MARPSGDQAAPVFRPGCFDTRRARPPPADTIQRSGLLRAYEVNATSPPPGEYAGSRLSEPIFVSTRHAPAVHVDGADLVRAAAAHRERDARAEDAALAGERLHDVVGEFVDGVADVGVAVALGQRRLVAARDDVHPAFELAARRLHLDDRLRADLASTAPTRTPRPSLCSCAGKRRRVEDLEQPGDVHVLRHRLDGGGAGVALGARHRQLQHLHAGARDREDRAAGPLRRAAPAHAAGTASMHERPPTRDDARPAGRPITICTLA